jgi:hypothetical protein
VKSITPVDHYICELSDELRELARKELNETDEIREKSIQAIRDWALENPRIIKTRLDSIFILRFLRHRKFDLEKTKDSIERWMINFKVAGFDHKWFSTDYDVFNNQHMREILKNKLNVLLPKKDQNLPIINLCRIIAFDYKVKGILPEVFTTAVLVQEMILEQEEAQIKGTIVIADCSNSLFRHAIMLSVMTWNKLLRNTEVIISLRFVKFDMFSLFGCFLFFQF